MGFSALKDKDYSDKAWVCLASRNAVSDNRQSSARFLVKLVTLVLAKLAALVLAKLAALVFRRPLRMRMPINSFFVFQHGINRLPFAVFPNFVETAFSSGMAGDAAVLVYQHYDGVAVAVEA